MGHERDTTCVAFVPGFMQRADAWQPIAGARVVEWGAPSFDACVDAIRATAEGGVVVAYSMGGRLALHAAVRHPEAYRALVLVGATPGIEDEAQRRARRTADEELARWMEAEQIEAVVDFWESQPVFATQSAELRAAQRADRLRHDPQWLAAMLRATGQGVLPPVWDRLPALQIPVLAVAGELDTKYVTIAQSMAEALPNGRATVIPGVGHAAHLEDPGGFADLLLEFLDEHLGQGVVVDRDA